MEKLNLEQVTIKALSDYSFFKLFKQLQIVSLITGVIASFIVSNFIYQPDDKIVMHITIFILLGVMFIFVVFMILLILYTCGFFKSLRSRYENQLNYEQKRRVIINYINDRFLKNTKSNIEFCSRQIKEAEKSIEENSEISQHYNWLLIEVI